LPQAPKRKAGKKQEPKHSGVLPPDRVRLFEYAGHHGIEEERVNNQLADEHMYQAIEWTFPDGTVDKVLDPENKIKFHKVNKDWSTFTTWKDCSICANRDKR
jgi:hypothetical protein